MTCYMTPPGENDVFEEIDPLAQYHLSDPDQNIQINFHVDVDKYSIFARSYL